MSEAPETPAPQSRPFTEAVRALLALDRDERLLLANLCRALSGEAIAVPTRME